MAAELYHSMRKIILRYLIFFLILSGLNAGESAYYIAANNRSDPLAEILDFIVTFISSDRIYTIQQQNKTKSCYPVRQKTVLICVYKQKVSSGNFLPFAE